MIRLLINKLNSTVKISESQHLQLLVEVERPKTGFQHSRLLTISTVCCSWTFIGILSLHPTYVKQWKEPVEELTLKPGEGEENRFFSWQLWGQLILPRKLIHWLKPFFKSSISGELSLKSFYRRIYLVQVILMSPFSKIRKISQQRPSGLNRFINVDVTSDTPLIISISQKFFII